MKSTVKIFEEASKIDMRVDSAIWGVTQNRGEGSSSTGQGPTPMEIGNVENRGRGRGRLMDAKRIKYYRNNACFTCNKVGCRPWKHQSKGDAANNFEV